MKKIAFLSLLVFLFTGCDGFLDSENLVKRIRRVFRKHRRMHWMR